MDQQRSDLYEPSSRFSHVATSVSDGPTSQVIVWGGETPELYSNDASRIQLASVVEQFDTHTEVWHQRHTRGTPHPGLSAAACTSSGNHLFMYGGYCDNTYSNFSGALSCLNVKTLTWSQLCPAGTASGPMLKAACGMVHFHHDKLAVIFGYGIPSGPTQPGSTFIRSTKVTDGRGWTNEIHVFDLSQGVWFSPTVSGTRPPPCSHFTLTSIDNHQAVLFGGGQPGHGQVSDLYLIDFNTMEITKVEPREGEPWPVGRANHAACCLGYAGDHIHLLITGGTDRGGKTLKDSWLFNLLLKKWKEVTLPDGNLPRRGHFTTAITLCPGLVEVNIFGGTTDDLVKDKPDSSLSRIAETTIITFGLIGSEWEVMGVASNNKLIASERVREKMLLKSGTDTQGLQLSSTLDSEVTPYALYRLERGGVQVRREISSKNKDFQAVLQQKQPDANSAMVRWISSVHQTSLKPTWKTLLLVLRLINLDHLAEQINTYLSGGAVKQLPEGTSASKEQEKSLSEVFTFAALTQLEKREGIPVLTQLEAKNHEFQTIIRVKQSDASWAINKWLTTPVLSHIKPMWKSLLCVLRLINLDHLADDIEAYSKKHSLSSLGEDKGGVIEKLRDELLALCDKLKEGDEDENIHHLKKIKALSKSAIKKMKEESVSLVDIKRRQPSPAPPQPGTVEETKMTKTEPASPSMIISTEETALTAAKKELLAKDLMSISTAVADANISMELFEMVRRKVQEIRDQLALVQSPGEVMDIKPTPAQTATMTTQSHVHVKEEPLEVLPSAAVYSAFDAAVKTETGMEIQALGSPLAFVPPPEGIIETPPTSAQLRGFRGVEVCGETTVVVTNDPQSFAWEGYGLKIHIPKGCLPAGMEQCTINIKASLAGQYEFPENTHLVSAVFWLRCEPRRCKFTVPVSLEIQHCARPENISKLSFVKALCSQESLPYTFRRQQGGRFTSSSSYGVLELESFSGVGAVQEGSEDREYIARLFYQSQITRSYEIHLVVTWNIEAYLTAVELKYNQALPGPDQPVDFESDQIELDIPEDGITLQGGWVLTPLTTVVTKKHVDNYHPGKRIPNCQLSADLEDDSTEVKVVPFRYRIKLLGAKKPHNKFTIKPPASSVRHGVVDHSSSSSITLTTKRSLTHPSTEGPLQKKFKMMSQPNDTEPANKGMPELKDLMKELYTKVADVWEDIGILLGVKDGQLKQIRSDNANDSRSCLREMLRIWLSRIYPPTSWSAIAEATEFLGYENLAAHLRSTYCN